MSQVFLKTVANCLKTANHSFTGMKEFAPGVIGVTGHHPFIRDGGEEFHVYFDLTRWELRTPQHWEKSIHEEDGSGHIFDVNPHTFETMLSFASRQLNPLQPNLTFHDKPMPISLNELFNI